MSSAKVSQLTSLGFADWASGDLLYIVDVSVGGSRKTTIADLASFIAAQGGGAHNFLSATHSDTVASSPVLGGLVYANATPKWQQLAGNTTATKKFLSQTGDGAISAAPAWSIVTGADVGLVIGVNVQGWDPDLDALAGLGGTNTIYYRSGVSTWSAVTIGTGLDFTGGTLSSTSGASGANPTASVGLSAVNGSAGTFLRSDGAPALSQAIAPTWTAAHIFAPGSDGVVPWTAQVHHANDRAFQIKYTDGSVKSYWDFTWGYVVENTYGLHSLGVLNLSATTAHIAYKGTYHAFQDASGSGENVLIYGGTGAAQAILVDPSANSMQGMIIGGRSGITPGVMLQMQRPTSTTAYTKMSEVDADWLDSTHATRKGRLYLRAWDTAVRECARAWSDGGGRFACAAPASAPTNSHIAASQVSFYLDEAGNNLKFRVCYADGSTYKTGTLAVV